MRHWYRTSAGFTLIETIVILMIIGILIAVAVPKMASLREEAVNAMSISIIAHVNAGIRLYRFADEEHRFPDRLDYAGPGDSPATTPYFSIVIVGGITDPEWEKVQDIYTYIAPNDSMFVYDPDQGVIR